jgi:RHS repeat-associated protein
MLASSFFDAMLGLDVHWEMVPMPAPVPTPIPNPFTGIVRDFSGLAAGLALSNAIGAVMGASPKGPVVYWGMIPATNTGTNGIHIPGHILIPPGVSWAPVPKAPKPVIRPNETPTPPKPASPDNDAIIVFGSKTVTVLGSNAVRMGDQAMSCSEPVRLPSTVVIAVPKGSPILIGGPPSLDIMAAVMASLRTRFVSDSLHSLISRMAPGRFRNFLHRATCFFTGHPVDVATGKVLTETIEAELPGPIPLKIQRVYTSSNAAQDSVLGYGWSHSLNQAIWQERGKVVYLAEDGREIEFDTFDLPDHQLKVGMELWHPIDRMTLRRHADNQWSLRTADGYTLFFSAVTGGASGHAVLQRISAPSGLAHIVLHYGPGGLLESVHESAGREIRFEYDDRRRLRHLALPHPEHEGWYAHRRYRYDDFGDLVEVVDSLGNSWRYEYETHLLVRERTRSGLNFYFEYDGLGADAWCVRTWGDGGLYDHRIGYDKQNHVTFVTDSLGRTKQYHMNAVGAVVRIVDALGGETKFEYDNGFRRTAVTDALGRRTQLEYDGRGNCVGATRPDSASLSATYDSAGRPTQIVDYVGGVWKRRYDQNGSWRERIDPLGRVMKLSYDGRGLLHEVERHDGTRILYERDEAGLVSAVRDGSDRVTRFAYDRLGRLRETRDALGNREIFRRNTEGKIVEATGSDGRAVQFFWNTEGDLVEARDPAGVLVHIGYTGYRKRAVISRPEGELRFRHDSEQQIMAVENAAGEMQRYHYDSCGRIAAVTRFDGQRWTYERDKLGRITAIQRPSRDRVERRYDAGGRVTELRYSDGTSDRFVYRADGALIEANNAAASVRFERDLLGQTVRERQDEHWIESEVNSLGNRVATTSSFGVRQVITRDTSGEAAAISVRDLSDPWRDLTDPWRVDIRRDARGVEFERTLPGGVRAQWQRDRRGRPTARKVHRADTQLTETQYHWSLDDQLVGLTDGTGRTTRFVRDASLQLTGVFFADGTEQCRRHDRAGNIFAGPDGQDRIYGASGQIQHLLGAKFRYDVDGRCTGRLESDGTQWRYQYDGAGRLATVVRPDGARVSFEYDALGRRIRKTAPTGTTRWIWDRAVPVCEQASTSRRTTWVFDPGTFAPVGMLSSQGNYSIVTDHLGTPSAAYDNAGTVAWSAELDLYGVPRHTMTPRIRLPWRWPGQYADEETGLYYNRYRYYDATAGQYLTPDPLGLAGGGTTYGYVADPLTSVDPLGLEECTPYYHGTTKENADRIIANGIDLESGRFNLDFNPTGQGAFYVTRDPEQAARWAQETAERLGGEPAVVRFDVPESELAALESKVFTEPDPEWADFVRNSRSGGGGPEHHSYDIVEGPFVTNPSDAENAMSSKPLRGRGDQTAVCTPRAADAFDRSNPRIDPPP